MWFVQWSLDHSTGLALEANWKGWKSLISRRLLNWPKLKQKTNKKNTKNGFELSSMQQGTIFLIKLQDVTKSGLPPCKTITFQDYARQISAMHWELHCLLLFWINRSAQFFSMTKLNPMAHNQPFKSFTFGLRLLFLLYHILLVARQLSSSSISQLFVERTLAETAGCRIYFLGWACRIQKNEFLH